MKHYIIDGNNLIGKVKSLFQLQKKDGQSSREKLAFMIDKFFYSKNAKVSICFDGFMQIAINTSKSRIFYSDKRSADEVIKNMIEQSRNPKLIVLVSSDRNLLQFAKLCHCDVITSEEFYKEISSKNAIDEESEKRSSISNDEIKKLFGL
jgi:predicted RNA-binding protein with PIN domain